MSRIFRMKFEKYGDMRYISHLDVQRLLHRAFRRAEIEVSYSQGFNPHPKMSYGNALALGVESFGEYVDVEIEDDFTTEELLDRINHEMPETMKFVKCVEISPSEKALASNIEYGKYEFVINIDMAKAGVKNPDTIHSEDFTEESVSERLANMMSRESISITKKNKKGKLVDVDIRPMIKSVDLICADGENIKIGAVLATGSKQNLNTNIFIPKLLSELSIEMDPLDVDVIRYDLYFVDGDNLVSPI